MHVCAGKCYVDDGEGVALPNFAWDGKSTRASHISKRLWCFICILLLFSRLRLCWVFRDYKTYVQDYFLIPYPFNMIAWAINQFLFNSANIFKYLTYLNLLLPFNKIIIENCFIFQEIFELSYNGSRFVVEEMTRHETGPSVVMNCACASTPKRTYLVAGQESHCQLYTVSTDIVSRKRNISTSSNGKAASY